MTSRLIERLRKAFPGVAFSASTYVVWTDGPTEAEVRKAMGDLINGDGRFQRTLSPEFQAELEAIITKQDGREYNAARYYKGGFRIGNRKTFEGYGNEQVGQLSEMLSKT